VSENRYSNMRLSKIDFKKSNDLIIRYRYQVTSQTEYFLFCDKNMLKIPRTGIKFGNFYK